MTTIDDKITRQQRIAPQHEHRPLAGLGDLAVPDNAAVLLQHGPGFDQGSSPSGSVTCDPIASVGAPA